MMDLLRPTFGQKMPQMIRSHDVLEPLKQVLSASRDVISPIVKDSSRRHEKKSTNPLLHLFEKGQGARGPGSRGGPGSWLSRTPGGLGVGIP